FETRVSLAGLHVGTEAADAGEDGLACFRMTPDFARQREQAERAVDIDIVGRNPARDSRALGLLALDRLAELDVGAEAAAAQRPFKSRGRILAQALVAVFRVAFARHRERAGEAALGIVRAADEGAEPPELEREAAAFAARAFARVDAVGARREDMRRQ